MKAAFAPEGFRSRSRDWEIIKEADEVLEKAREFVLANALK